MSLAENMWRGAVLLKKREKLGVFNSYSVGLRKKYQMLIGKWLDNFDIQYMVRSNSATYV